MVHPIKNQIGRKFGLFGCLTVVARAPGRSPSGNAIWLCDCACGSKLYPVSGSRLKSIKSCGCLQTLHQPPPKKEPLTQALLKKLLDYDPQTGIFTWKVALSSNVKIGSRAGCINQNGYRVIRINGKGYKAHRLAWLYIHGSLPKTLDHKNHNRPSCHIADLREATSSQNNANAKMRKDNRAGLKGVHQSGQRWGAAINHNGNHLWLGTFDTPELAHIAYLTKAKELFGEFACTG
jgi:hypothetical protein